MGSGETFYRRRDMVNRRNPGANSTALLSATVDAFPSSREPSPTLSSTVLPGGRSGYQNGGGLLNPALLYREERGRLAANAGTATAVSNSCSCVKPEEDLNG